MLNVKIYMQTNNPISGPYSLLSLDLSKSFDKKVDPTCAFQSYFLSKSFEKFRNFSQNLF